MIRCIEETIVNKSIYFFIFLIKKSKSCARRTNTTWSKSYTKGKTQQGDQPNQTGQNQKDQYDNLCQKMKQKRQNFKRATEELNAAANQLLKKRKHNKEQYFTRTTQQCRDAIPKMMNAGASTQQGVGEVTAFGKAGVGALSKRVTSLFTKKQAA